MKFSNLILFFCALLSSQLLWANEEPAVDETALRKFEAEVGTGQLTVIGTVHGFQNTLQQGQGRLAITNINGKTDTGSIMAALMKFSGTGMRLDKKPGQTPPIKKPEN